MKTKLFLSVMALGLTLSAFSQKATIELTFTAENNGQYVPLDSILIENLTQGGDTTLFAPDTVFVLDYITDIRDNENIGNNSFSFSQNYPNPFKGKTTIDLYLPEKEHIKITVRDILGRELAHYKNLLDLGNHSFAFYPGNEKYYLLTVTGKQTSKTIKMLNADRNTTNSEECKIIYTGNKGNMSGYKSQKAINDFIFNLGDELLFVGYSDFGESGMIKSPSDNQTYTFEFATNIPCPGTPTVTYEGQVYNSIQIFSQCWLKQNLNIGTMINGNQNQLNNGTIEKYCQDDSQYNCQIYGGLYQWEEMMQYVTADGSQGICPDGWHIPTDEEWKVLEGAVDSQYFVGDTEWDEDVWRGFDVGENLKYGYGWYNNGNGTDLYEFSALPGGYCNLGYFVDLSYSAYFWTSTKYGNYNAWYRTEWNSHSDNMRYSRNYLDAVSVRCIKD